MTPHAELAPDWPTRLVDVQLVIFSSVNSRTLHSRYAAGAFTLPSLLLPAPMALSSAPSPECVAAVHAWSAANRPGFFVGRGNGLKKLTGSLGRIIDASIDSREVRAIVDIGAGMYYPKGRRDEYVKAGPRTAPPLDQPDMMVGGSGTPTLAACLGPDWMRTAGWTPSHSAR